MKQPRRRDRRRTRTGDRAGGRRVAGCISQKNKGLTVKRSNPCLVEPDLHRSGFAGFVSLLYFAADCIDRALTTLTNIFHDSLSTVTELLREFICTGTGIGSRGLGTGNCLFSSHLRLVAQFNRLVLDYCAGLFPGLGREQ